MLIGHTELVIAPRSRHDLPTKLRITRGFDYCTTANSPDEIAHAFRYATPGRYVVEEVAMAGALLPSGDSCRRWGTAIRHDDGQMTLDLGPKLESMARNAWPAP